MFQCLLVDNHRAPPAISMPPYEIELPLQPLFNLSSTSPIPPNIQHLIRTCSSLASLQLVKVPSTDLHVATVVIQALCEHLSLVLAVASVVGILLGLLSLSLGLSLSGRSGGTATEEAADGVANGGTDGDTTVSMLY